MVQFAPMIAGGILMSSTLLVDNAMAAMLDAGSVSALSYANRLVAVINGVGASALGTAVFPYFSRMVANEDWGEIRTSLMVCLRLIFAIAVPLTILLVVFSDDIVRVLFERGAFGSTDTRLVGRVQAYLLLQVPFYVAGIFLVRLISAFKENRLLMWGTAISVLINVTMNYVCMRFLGVAGIALSTSIVYVVSLTYLSVVLHRLIESRSK
jgi:putative peptidoglycan lipid II flippase